MSKLTSWLVIKKLESDQQSSSTLFFYIPLYLYKCVVCLSYKFSFSLEYNYPLVLSLYFCIMVFVTIAELLHESVNIQIEHFVSVMQTS